MSGNKSKVVNRNLERQITYYCKEKEHQGSVIVGGDKSKRLSFRCELCNLLLMPDEGNMTLLAHGRTVKTINHQLNKIEYL